MALISIAVLIGIILLIPLAEMATQTASNDVRVGALPQYPTTINDTADHPLPFYLRVMSDDGEYDGHNMQSCSIRASAEGYGSWTSYSGGCIDPNLSSPVLALELRNGSLYTRKLDEITGTYTDAGQVGGLKNITNAWDGTDDQFDAQSFAFANATDATHSDLFNLPSDTWTLQVTSQYQGIGVYQLMNIQWNHRKSTRGAPWVLTWMLCFTGGGDGGQAALAWLQSARSDPIPVPDGCSIVQLQVCAAGCRPPCDKDDG